MAMTEQRTQTNRKKLPKSLVPPAPRGYSKTVDSARRRKILERLDSKRNGFGVSSLLMTLHMSESLLERVEQKSPGDPERDRILRENYNKQMNDLLLGWEYAAPPGSIWRNAVTHYPHIHACALRGPIGCLTKFLESNRLDQPLVAKICMNESLGARARKTGDVVRTTPAKPSGTHADQVHYVSAASGEEKIKRLTEILALMKTGPEEFLHSLGIGDFRTRWRDVLGAGQCICLLDSGSDESHPALQGRIRSHTIIDALGSEKLAKYALDRGCHGTKMAGIIAANILRDPLLNIPYPVRLGLAPRAQVASVNLMQGHATEEMCSIAQLLNGLDWAVQYRDHTQLGGFRVVNVSMEVYQGFGQEVTPLMDDALEFVMFEDLVPILAAGNNSKRNVRLGTKGTYVGVCDSFGKAWEANGPYDLLAPGLDYPCYQPPLAQMDDQSLDLYSGSSIAAAVTSGAVVLLTEASGRHPRECLAALKEHFNDEGGFSLNGAYDRLS